MLGASWLRLPLTLRVTAVGTLVAGGVFGLSLWSSNAELHAFPGAHPEHVTAVSVEQRVTADCPAGRTQTVPGWDITWRSANPPTGQSAVFVESDACDKATVGEHATVERSRLQDGSVEVRHLVAATEASALAIASGLGGVAGPAAAFFYRRGDQLRQRRLAYWRSERAASEAA